MMQFQRAVLRPIAAALIAAALAVPAIAQTTGGALVSTGPGTVSASRVVTTTATVTAIDMSTRQVTLRRADGSSFSVVAGPDVRNLAQVRVGDTVSIDFLDSLALELKKGGTGAPASRTDEVAGSRAELGQRPGASATRETVIVADVVAVDAAGQTISLRGPQGKVVVLPVKDPEQFKRIAVGDQVQATYIESVALSVTPVATPAATTPASAPWSPWMIGLRVININPNASSSISGLDVKDQWTGEADFTYFFTKNIAAELIAAWAKHEVTLNGTGIGKVGVLPPTLLAQWHFTDLGAWKPYVGGGLNYTYFYKNQLQIPTGFASPNSPAVDLHIKNNSWGGALQAGLDYQIEKNWYLNFDVKYIWISTDVYLNATGAKLGSLDVNPWVYGVGVRYRF
jgi:outer membrane protein